VTARVDGEGRLVAADTPILTLQEQAGGKLGRPLAVPQLAAIARLAARLGVSISRSAVAASETEDIELWVRADPDTDGVTLTVERSTVRPPARPRWAGQPAETSAASDSEQELTIDPELKVVRVAPGLARRLGLAGADLIGRPLARLLRPVEDEDGNLPLLAALAGRHPFANQTAIIRETEETVCIHGTPRFVDEQFQGYSVRLATPNAALAVTALPLDDLLKEPLAAIIGQAQEIAARSEGPLRSDYAGYGSDIAAAARHLLELLAAISPRQGGEGATAGEPLDLAELVLDAAGLIQAQAAARGVVLDIGGAGRLPARGQSRAVTQILVNLIGNAVRFSPEGGEIAIMLHAGGEATVTVSDRGPGVAPEDRSRIFERFEQAGTKPGEAGLGLSISRRLAREMGGDVELLPSASGATFRLRLPTA
jgi:signal transduction histidine kinase